MTIFGPDISSYQGGINVGALPSPFVLMKCTEGLGYADAYYPRWLEQVKTAGKIPVAYHFIGPSDPAGQAAHLAANIIDRGVRVMVDFEDEGAFHPTLAQLLAVNDAITAAGLHVKLNYFPRWKWQELGSPSLAPLAARGIGLVSSSYPGGSGYPGDNAAGWQTYGGMVPTLYQFTDAAVVGGQRVGDMNAFRGSVSELAVFLGGSSSPLSPQGGTTMGTIPPSIGQKWPDVAGEFPAGQSFDNDTALIWSDAGARVAALFALQARDEIRALAAKVGQPATVDVNALSAALAPLLNAGASADEVATAVVQHLAATLQKG